jgi:hypothetical protein
MKTAHRALGRTGPSATYRWTMARMSESGSNWQRLGDQLRQRRLDLSMTQEEVTAAGGPSTATQRLLEGGHRSKYRDSILRKEEVALRLARGSVAAALTNGEITPLEELESDRGVPDAEESPIEDIMAVIETIRERFGDALADEAWERTKERRRGRDRA